MNSKSGRIRERIEGRNLVLEPFDKSFITDRYVSWLQDPEVTKFLGRSREEPQSRETATEFVESFEGPVEKYMWAIVPRSVGDAVGTCTLYNIDRYNGLAEMGLLIGEKDYWGKGTSDETIELLAAFAFDRLGLRRLTAGSSAKNLGMNFTFKKLGFTLEGRLRESMRVGDTFGDGYRWGLLAREWRERKSARAGA